MIPQRRRHLYADLYSHLLKNSDFSPKRDGIYGTGLDDESSDNVRDEDHSSRRQRSTDATYTSVDNSANLVGIERAIWNHPPAMPGSAPHVPSQSALDQRMAISRYAALNHSQSGSSGLEPARLVRAYIELIGLWALCHGYHISHRVVHWRANVVLLLSYPIISLP